MDLVELKARIADDTAPRIEVHGIDPSIYLIFGCDAELSEPIKNKDGTNLSFRSRSRAFDALRDVGITHVDFVHRSAFDEMVGIGDGTPTEHRESIKLSSNT